jgi:hypothetical protein
VLSDNLFTPEHPNITSPADTDAKIWRYMSFARFCTLLRTQQLYFSSAASFDDPWEGSHGMWYGAGVELISFFKKIVWAGTPMHEFSTQWNRWVRGWTYANCWHMNPGDSEAMWKLYASDEGSVAIQSTYPRLRAVLPSDVGIGCVYYIDFYASPPSPQPFKGYPTPFVFKRKSLEHERELRALLQRVPLTAEGAVDFWNTEHPAGITIDVDLPALIETVHVQPDAAPWLLATVKDVTARYNLDVPVEQSDDEALF